MISIWMVKLFDASPCKPLELILKSCLESGKFPLELKKAIVIPAHKKGDKQILKNYCPISSLPIAEKIFEKILYNNISIFLKKSNLISLNQLRFKSDDSYINQLLSITHEIYVNHLTMVLMFVVLHKSLLYKSKQNRISGNLLDTMTEILNSRKQRVALNRQLSSWASIETGIPQGSILGPLLLLIYINNLSDDLITNPKLFANDTSPFFCKKVFFCFVNTSSTNLNNDLSKMIN